MKVDKNLNLSSELHLVFLHGWGMNGAIFDSFCERLQVELTQSEWENVSLSTIDLPGYGDNVNEPVTSHNVEEMVVKVEQQLPANSILIAWSLGGLVAQSLAARQSVKLIGLITICSSPKFVKEKEWAGIEPQVLSNFQKQLAEDTQKTLKRFLAIQNLGQASAKTDIQKMLAAVTSKALAKSRTLKLGLQTLQETDLRELVSQILIPTLRVYGRLDSLVPHSAVEKIAQCHQRSDSVVYAKASHAPFMSHPDLLISDIFAFLEKLKNN